MLIKNAFIVALAVSPAVILAAPLPLPVQNPAKSVDVNVVSTPDPVSALGITSTSVSDGSEGIADGQTHRHRRRGLREIGQRTADHFIKYANGIRGSTECLPRAITRITGITATATTTNTITTATATSTAATATATATATAQTSTQQEAKIFYGNLSSIVQRLEAAFGALKEGKSIEEAEGIMKEVFEK
ncbi:hypothetical protein FRC16_004189 [Serendipita sp. 398]|nr:hypothetical protein FRC16_004189 [Serendipita sp. 398]